MTITASGRLEKASVIKPRFSIDFVTEDSKYYIRQKGRGTDIPNTFTSESIISLTTSNALENDAGAFSFVLVGHVEWDKKLQANDIVTIRVEPRDTPSQLKTPKASNAIDLVARDYDGNKPQTLIIGLIAEVKREADYRSNMVMYRITGQSLAKAFMQFDIRPIRMSTLFADTEVGWLGVTGGSDQGINMFQGNSVKENISGAIGRFIKYMKYDFGGNKEYIFERMELVIDTWDDEGLGDSSPFVNFAGSFNQMLINLANKPFNEMFFDVSDTNQERVKLVVRRTPFDKADWKALKRNWIYSEDVLAESLGQNDLDTYTIFSCLPTSLLSAPTLNSALPRYSPAMLGKYGYRLLEVENKYLSSIYTGADGSIANSEGKDVVKYSKKLYKWFCNNPNFFSGDITIVGNPSIRLGNRLGYKDPKSGDIWEFYIESVTHTFSYTEGFVTTLGVTRGLQLKNASDEGQRFSTPFGASIEFKGGYLGEASLAEQKEAAAKRDQAAQAGHGSSTPKYSSHHIPVKAAELAMSYADNKKGRTIYEYGGGHSGQNPLTKDPPYMADCSGFVYWIYKMVGVDISNGGSRTTTSIAANKKTLTTLGNIGSQSNISALALGDLVFFNDDTHVGIYVGDGNFVAFNGDTGGAFTIDTSGGCQTRSMVTNTYWKNAYQGHYMRLRQEFVDPTKPQHLEA